MKNEWVKPWNTDRKLDLIINLLTDIRAKEVKKIMATMDKLNVQIVDLIAKVTAENTVIDSAEAAFKGLADQVALLGKELADAIATGNPAAIQTAADAITAQAKVIAEQDG